MLIIERFAEDFGIVEDDKQQMTKYPRAYFDPSCCEGDVIEEKDGIFYPDKQKTEKLRNGVIRRLDRLGL